ncbi:hypothetical protein NFI96_010026 [Prochilodus magdalenae]|nr:hypothetical protein NFI96_010026 [Prochilodus magdalenae]
MMSSLVCTLGFSDPSKHESGGGDAQRIRVWRHRGQHQDERSVVTRPEGLVSLHLHPYRTICRNRVRMFKLHGMDYHRTPLGTSTAPYRDVWRNIKNTEPLDSKKQRVHSFWVTAFDCGKNRAQADAQVVVTVKPSCKPGWIGWSKRVEYTPGSGSIPLFPSLHLETCEETVWNIQATVELQTGHIGKGCDRDSYSDRSVRRLCGAVRGEVDLLPPPSPAANWTAALPTLPSSDSSLVFSFNGSAHVAVVPDSVASMVSGDHFTLQLWMRRGGASTQPPANQARGTRKEEETIICSTVKNDDSYSHYALSVHGCRLSLFYWPDVSAARPVKFLWKLEQVCDSEWHHLSLSVQFPSVTLYVDGVTFDPALIHDNGAIPNPAPRQRLVIGACWGE